MTPSTVVRSPLIGESIGSSETDFTITEHLDTRPWPRSGIPLHLHRSEDEAWYILDGSLGFRFGEEEFSAVAGAAVLLPKGVPHTFWNPGPGPARYLLIVGPKTAGLLAALHGPSRIPAPELRSVYSAFDADLVD